MKNIIWIICLILPVTSQQCTTKTIPDKDAKLLTSVHDDTMGTLIILVNDLSLSDGFLQPDSTVLRQLLMRHAFRGVQLSGILIKSDSRSQEAYLSPVIRADTTPLTHNFIANRTILQQNKARLATVPFLCKQVAQDFSSQMFLAHDQDKSDVQNALRLGLITAKLPQYRNWRIWVVIVSDLQQDVKPGSESLLPVAFPANVRLILIGNHPEIDVNSVFPGIEITELPSFHHLISL